MDSPIQIPGFLEQSEAVYNKTVTENQYGVSPIPAHTHNGTDSLQVSFSTLADRVAFYSFTIPSTSAATAGNYSVFFIAPYALTVLGLQEVHAVKGTDGGAVTLGIEKLTGTTAPGSGTTLLVTDFNLKANINTVQTGTLARLISTRNLAAGNRLAFKLTGTPTSVANVTVSLVIGF